MNALKYILAPLAIMFIMLFILFYFFGDSTLIKTLGMLLGWIILVGPYLHFKKHQKNRNL